MHIVDKGARKAVGNGYDTLFWLDKWLFDTHIVDLIEGHLGIVELYQTIRDL